MPCRSCKQTGGGQGLEVSGMQRDGEAWRPGGSGSGERWGHDPKERWSLERNPGMQSVMEGTRKAWALQLVQD